MCNTEYTKTTNIEYEQTMDDIIVKDKYFIENLENFKKVEFRKYYFDNIILWLKSEYPTVDIKTVIGKIYGYMASNKIIQKVNNVEVKAICNGFYKPGRPEAGDELSVEQRAERKRKRAKEYYKRHRQEVCLKARQKHRLKSIIACDLV